MGTQNFRVKNGLEVGSATTVTQTSAFVGSNFAVSGVSTFQSDVFVNGTLVAGGSGGGGGSFGADVVTRNLYASGISTFAGLLTGTTASFSGDVTVGGVLKYEDVVNVDSVGIATARAGLRITGGGLDVVGVSTFDDSVIFDSTGSIQVPVGNTSERPGIAVTGQLRYNSELTSFEGYGPGGEWGSLGGVKDVDGDTYIIPESSPNADEDILYFYNAGTNTVAISSTTATINVNLDVDGHTELDALNVAGIVTATRFDGDLNALGKTYYVATTGSDSNSGNNINEPFLTIEQALSVAGNGNVINISAGTYEETCPLTVPRGVTVKGAGLRATTIKPTDATKTNNVFELNDISTLEDFTVRNSYYDSSADTGYAFAYATGIAITTRSPYIQRVTVLNAGSIVSSSDPYGYDTPDNPPTSYLAGRGALVDGSLVASNSLEAGMLFNEATFFTPNNKGIVLTNGARAEYLNCFHYFASQAIVGLGGTVGIAGTAEARLKFRTPGVTPSVNDVVKLFDSGGSVVAVGTITNYDDPYARISGKGYGTFTSVGIGTTQRVEFYQSDGTTFTGIASAISFADYTMFGAEMRSVGCAVEYGSQGVVADGVGVQLRLFATNFNHVGTGKDFTNDPTLVVQANEVIELNDGQVSYVSIDQGGDFRVGDALYINQETGNVSFAATTYDLEVIGNLQVTDELSNTTLITPTSITVGNVQIAANGTVSTTAGDLTIDPAGSNKTIINGDLTIDAGNLNVTGVGTFGELDVTGDFDVNGHAELDNVNVSGIATVFDLNVDGHTELDNVNISGVTTFVGAIDANGDLDVDGHTELDNVNVSGVSTFVGVGTFQSDLYVGGSIFAPAINIEGGATIGDDIITRNISASGIVTVTANTDLNGDLDVDGHTELDNVNISGIVTTFDLNVDGHTELDNVNISGIATVFDVNVDGHTELDNVNVSGIATVFDLNVDGHTELDNVNISGIVTAGSITVNGHSELDYVRASGVVTSFGLNVVGRSDLDDVNISGIVTTSRLNVQGDAELDFVNVSGVVTTTDLSVSGLSTFSGFVDINGGLDISNSLTVTGVSTFGSASFSGNVTVLGDLTYENVTNVDAVGIATARAGLRITGGGLDVVGISTFKNGVNLLSGGGTNYEIDDVEVLSSNTLGSGVVNSSLTSVGTLTSLNVGGDLDVDGHAEFDNVNISGIVTAALFEGSSQIGIQSGGLQIGVGITTLNFVGAGNSILVNSSDPTIIDISIAGNTGAGGTWSSYAAGIATTKSVGINTDNLDEPGLTGIGNSFKGLYISNGMIIHDNVLTGNHYIGTAFNGLMAGPVDVQGVLTIDGGWVVV